MGLISLVKRIGVATVAENRDVLVPQRPRRDSLHIAASARVLRVEDFEPGCEVLVPRVSKGHHFHTWCVVVGITLDKRLLVHVPGDGDVPISMHQLQREAEKLLDGPAGALLSQVNELQSRIKDLESQVARLQAASQPGTPRQHPAALTALITYVPPVVARRPPPKARGKKTPASTSHAIKSVSSAEHAALVERLRVHMRAHGLSQVRLRKHLCLSCHDRAALSKWLLSNQRQSLGTRAAIDDAVRAYLGVEAAAAPVRRRRVEEGEEVEEEEEEEAEEEEEEEEAEAEGEEEEAEGGAEGAVEEEEADSEALVKREVDDEAGNARTGASGQDEAKAADDDDVVELRRMYVAASSSSGTSSAAPEREGCREPLDSSWQQVDLRCAVTRQRLTDPARFVGCMHRSACNRDALLGFRRCPMHGCTAVVRGTKRTHDADIVRDDALCKAIERVPAAVPFVFINEHFEVLVPKRVSNTPAASDMHASPPPKRQRPCQLCVAARRGGAECESHLRGEQL